MTLFLIIFLFIYSGVHLLAIWACYPLLLGHGALTLLAAIWTLLMVTAPAAAHFLDKTGHESSARALAWIGYSWMGFVFYAFCFSVLLAFWQCGVWLTAFVFPQALACSIYGAQTALVILLLTLTIGIYGIFEARSLRIEKLNILTDRLPAGRASLTIAQVSDMHLGMLRRDEELGQVVSQLKVLNPDLLMATGDIVDAQISHLDGLVNLWQQIQPPLGKFAVTGNHEVYAGLQQSIDFLKASGFSILRNASIEVMPGIQLMGVDDPAGSGSQPDELELLRSLRSDALRIYLKHRPQVDDASLGLFDLQLSGHSHRGQLFPFNLLTRLKFPLQDGFYPLAKGSHLYTSRGTGTWGPPMRVGSPPEITLITFLVKNGASR
ncbi:metallophosphoesterase [Geopsychrobacter electrodiphilus]|uniref:metallophosphoesterase n=1 Tax=Geopsychrobacter electrodiphilus TaxID=225196 RepID=UPI00035C9971|nr:metallophosphoesterase [Geopsychrobacter electrodiphilus]